MHDDKTQHMDAAIIDYPDQLLVTQRSEGPLITMKAFTEGGAFIEVRIKSDLFSNPDGSMIASKGDRITISGEFASDGVQEYFRATRIVKRTGTLYSESTPTVKD